MRSTWEETSLGKSLRIEVANRHISFYPDELERPKYVAATGAISLWEGIAGLMPRGILARWRWRRGLRRLQHQIEKEVRLNTTE